MMEGDDSTPPLKWSGVFTLLPNDPTIAKTLSGDKIILPQSALEQLLAAAAASARQDPTRASNGYYNSNGFHTSFNGVSSSALYADNSQQLPNPLTFLLTNPKTGAQVYAGIREFSAPDETIVASTYLLNALGITIEENDLANVEINVKAVTIPKGTYARLRPLEAGYNPDDWRPLLERQLRQNFTSLTKDASLLVKGVHGETFQLLVDKFIPEGAGICVVDTDLEVDIEPLNEEQARETMRHIIKSGNKSSVSGKSSEGGDLDVWKSVDGQVLPGEYVDYILPSWDRSQALEIAITGIPSQDAASSIDLFVSPKSAHQRARPRDKEHVFGNFDIAQHGSKKIIIAASNIEMEHAESILISVHGSVYCDPALSEQAVPYTIRAKISLPNDINSESTAMDNMDIDSQSQSHGDHETQCKNCLQWVPKQTMILHENFCRRNNIVCPQCQQVFKKGSSEWDSHWHCELDEAFGSSVSSQTKHNAVYHTELQCPGCAFTTNSLPDLARHRTSICPEKIILCQFCHLEVPQEGDPFNISPEVALSGMTAHELADGARTTECHLCDKIVRLRDMETHMKHHELDKVGKSRPPICRNANCGRTLYGVGSRGQVRRGAADGKTPSNDLGLCSTCFGPLYVSMHDPEGKALKRRVERRYLGQLMTGCNRGYCGNEWCKTGRANIGLEAKGSSAQAALPAVKPLMAALPNPDEPVFFCTDEASQTWRKLSEMMASERVWDLEWCIAAAEAEEGQLERMREWLQAWAPRR